MTSKVTITSLENEQNWHRIPAKTVLRPKGKHASIFSMLGEDTEVVIRSEKDDS